MNFSASAFGLPELPPPPPLLDEKTGGARSIERLKHFKDDGTTDMVWVDPRRITIEPGHNVRSFEFGDQDIPGLADDIDANGQTTPVVCRYDPGNPPRAVLLAGQRRLHAQLLRLARMLAVNPNATLVMPVIGLRGTQSRDRAERTFTMLAENNHKNLRMFEYGLGFQALVREGKSAETIAKRLAKPLRFVTEALELADAPPTVHRLLAEERISDALALSYLRKHPADQVADLLQAAADGATAAGKVTATKARKTRTTIPFSALRKVNTAIADAVFERATAGDDPLDLATDPAEKIVGRILTAYADVLEERAKEEAAAAEAAASEPQRPEGE